MQWEKSVCALMINWDIFKWPSTVMDPCHWQVTHSNINSATFKPSLKKKTTNILV